MLFKFGFRVSSLLSFVLCGVTHIARRNAYTYILYYYLHHAVYACVCPSQLIVSCFKQNLIIFIFVSKISCTYCKLRLAHCLLNIFSLTKKEYLLFLPYFIYFRKSKEEYDQEEERKRKKQLPTEHITMTEVFHCCYI